MKRLSTSPDRGATALLVALCLMLLMGMAAIAVDLGGAFDDRRQQQSAADVGALAAVQYANTNYGTPSPCNTGTLSQISACRGALEAMAVIAGSINSRFTAADWAACVDSGDAAYPFDSGVSDCISFTDNLRKARVILPTTQVDTAFGGAIGWNSIAITSDAEAGADLNSSSDVIPFAVGPTGAGSNQACLFANPTEILDVAPCNGPSEGNFGFLDIGLYGNDSLGTSTDCTGDTQGRLATNIILGADHELTRYQTGDPIRNDRIFCPIFTALPNEVPTQTGGSNVGLEDGFFGSQLGVEGRLRCKDGDASEQFRFPKDSEACIDILNVYPENLDDTPLWDYLRPGAEAEASGGLCAPGSVNTRQEMESCLAAWNAWGSPHTISLFTEAIIDGPRFGATPELVSDPSNGTGNYLIVDFVPVYLETLYLGCNANSCSLVHSPGETSTGPCPPIVDPLVNSCGVPGNGNKNLRALTSFILELDMLPSSISAYFPSRPGTIEFNLIK